MSREALIEKVRKLRALSNCDSASIEEAATAARLAEQIIQAHALEELELEAVLGNQEEVGEDVNVLTNWKSKQTVWQNILLTHLTRAYNCQGTLQWKNDSIGYYAIGRPSDIATLRYQYLYFVLELTRLSRRLAPTNLARGSGKNWYNSFYLGAVRAIGDSLKSVKQEVKAQASTAALSIYDRHAEEALALKNKLHPGCGTKNFQSHTNPDAYNIGKRAGANLGIKPGLPSGVRGLLGS